MIAFELFRDHGIVRAVINRNHRNITRVLHKNFSSDVGAFFSIQLDFQLIDPFIDLKDRENEKMLPLLPDVRVPTLILAGEKSPIAQEAQMKAMQQQMPPPRSALLLSQSQVFQWQFPGR